jgi:hypothetical protein
VPMRDRRKLAHVLARLASPFPAEKLVAADIAVRLVGEEHGGDWEEAIAPASAPVLDMNDTAVLTAKLLSEEVQYLREVNQRR